MYAPWAFYMGIWALYNPKLPLWPLIGLADLAGDLAFTVCRLSFIL
jgi:hypothetical protein